jgi:hypothetical protein
LFDLSRRVSAELGRRHSCAGLRGSVFVPVLPEGSSEASATRQFGTARQAVILPVRSYSRSLFSVVKRPLFLRRMEEKNCDSPLFGIPVLKRLSMLSAEFISVSRETFNALEGTIVKYNL